MRFQLAFIFGGLPENIQNKSPYLVKSFQIEFFLGGMTIKYSRPEGDRVESGQLFGEKAALKTGMDCLDVQRLIEEISKGARKSIANR